MSQFDVCDLLMNSYPKYWTSMEIMKALNLGSSSISRQLVALTKFKQIEVVDIPHPKKATYIRGYRKKKND